MEMMQVVGNEFFIGKLKNIIMLLLLMFLFMSCTEKINPNLLGICKEETNELRLLYLDQRGICEVETSVSSDTLILDIRVSTDAKQDFFNVVIPENIKYVKYGNVIKEINQLKICTAQPRSGDEALEYLKSLER